MALSTFSSSSPSLLLPGDTETANRRLVRARERGGDLPRVKTAGSDWSVFNRPNPHLAPVLIKAQLDYGAESSKTGRFFQPLTHQI